MNNFIFKFFVFVCLVFGLAGCVFSWKPSIENSSVSVNDKTEASYETKEKE